MKKTIIAAISLGLLTTASQADYNWFVGLDYPAISNMNAKMEAQGISIDNDFEYQPVVFKVGAGNQGGLNMDVYFSSAKPDFSNAGEADKPVNEFGYDIRYELETSAKGFYPFGQVGLSYGWQKVEDTPQITWEGDYLKFVGLKIGVGLGYYINRSFQILAGADYKYWNWQDIKIYDHYGNSVAIDYTSAGTQIYFGANYWF